MHRPGHNLIITGGHSSRGSGVDQAGIDLQVEQKPGLCIASLKVMHMDDVRYHTQGRSLHACGMMHVAIVRILDSFD